MAGATAGCTGLFVRVGPTHINDALIPIGNLSPT